MPYHKSKPNLNKQLPKVPSHNVEITAPGENQTETFKNVLWTKAKRWKLFGQTLLLLAFFSQTLLFNHYDTKLNGLNSAYRDQYMMEMQGDLKELIYFQSLNSQDTILKNQYSSANITLAAQEFAKAQMMVNAGSTRSDSNKINLSNTFIQKSFQVKNFNDYLQFKDFIRRNKIQIDEISLQIDNLNYWKSFFFNVFIGVYLIGTVSLILGIIYEKS
jgi:hypothetical protein